MPHIPTAVNLHPKPIDPTTRKKRYVRTQEVYESIVDAYRVAPGNHHHCARMTGIDRSVCRRAWDHGWPPSLKAKDTIPVKQRLQRERDQAAAAAHERARKERELHEAELEAQRRARQEALTIEAEIMGDNRLTLGRLSKQLRTMAGWMPGLGWVIQEALFEEDPEKPGSIKPRANAGITPSQAMKLMSTFTLMTHRVAHATSTLLELSRLERGESTENVAIVDLVDPTEALAEMQAGATILDRWNEKKRREEADALESLGDEGGEDLGDEEDDYKDPEP